jgi:hypothetical protein
MVEDLKMSNWNSDVSECVVFRITPFHPKKLNPGPRMRRQLQRSVPYLSEEFLSFGMMRPIQRRVVKESVGEKAAMRCLRYRAIAHAGSMNSKKKQRRTPRAAAQCSKWRIVNLTDELLVLFKHARQAVDRPHVLG